MSFFFSNMGPPAWLEESSDLKDVVLFTETVVFRNIADIPFPANMTHPQREQISKEMLSILSPFFDYEYLLSELSFEEKYFLVERLHLPAVFLDNLMEVNLLVSRTERTTALINGIDHVNVHVHSASADFVKLMEEAEGFLLNLSERYRWAQHETFGYLSQEPLYTGAGVYFIAVCNLAGLELAGQIDALNQELHFWGARLNLVWVGEETPREYWLARVKSARLVGKSAQEVLSDFQNAIKVMVEGERQARKYLAAKKPTQFIDRLKRAYAILKHAETISLSELFSILPLYRLGVAEGIFDGDIRKIDQLFITARQAHIINLFGEDVKTRSDIDKFRAMYIRETLGL